MYVTEYKVISTAYYNTNPSKIKFLLKKKINRNSDRILWETLDNNSNVLRETFEILKYTPWAGCWIIICEYS